MVEQPSGRVTLVFTDIEGSTRLLEELGQEPYRETLARHRDVVRGAFGRFGGYEVDYEGDAFFYAFASAADAVQAVGEAMAGLSGGPISVRVGVHSGEPGVDRPKYVGMDVHRAARIMAAGHGGQVLVSETTRQEVGDGAVLRYLGEHRLKDFDAAVALYQLGEGEFPPLKTISNTNLPRPASSFVGREHEVGELRALLENGARLVTLTGPGGSGKTRLALEAATELLQAFKAGVFWVGLAAVRDAALVTETIAQTLGAKDGLADHVGERELLLLLDNLEQVVEAALELAALLEACPHLVLLVTSRELLRVRGEVELEVPPLAQSEAVSLFCERAGLQPTPEIAELCRRLDNLPLAVELAAARTRALTPSQLLERLSQRLDLLKAGRDADPRQQTLRATIEWSYDLLNDDEKELFRRLSVFPGGCTLEAAERVADAELDTLQSLVEKSLLRFTEGRYWMLESIRELACERLKASLPDGDLKRRHAECFGELAIHLARPMREGDADARSAIDAEVANLRAGAAFALDQRDAALAGKYLGGLWYFWLTAGYAREARELVERYLTLDLSVLTPAQQVPGLLGGGEVLRFTGDVERAIELKLALIATLRAHPETTYLDGSAARWIAAALSDLVSLKLELGELEQAHQHAEEALATRRVIGLDYGIGHALSALANVAGARKDFATARKLEAEALALTASDLTLERARGSIAIAEYDIFLGDFDHVHPLLATAFEAFQANQDVLGLAEAVRVAGVDRCVRGDPACGVQLTAAAEELRANQGLVLDRFGAERTAQVLHHARAALGEAGYQEAVRIGRSLTEEQAIQLAELPSE